MSFDQFSSISQKLLEIERTVGRVENHTADILDDHETRLRTVEGRTILVMSLGLALWALSLVMVWLFARGVL